MRAIYKKELRGYFTSVIGFIVMAVLLAVVSLYYVADCLISAYPVFGVVLSSVYFVMLIIVPLLTMRSFAEEKRQKTDQLLMTAPIAIWKIAVGKYLAMLTVFAIPMLLLCLYPLILLQFGSVSLPMAYTAIAGFFLYGAGCIAIGMFLSAVTESQVIAAVLTFGVLFFLNMSSSISSLIGASGILEKIFSAICIYQPFVNFSQGIFDMTGVIYYLAIIGLFLFLSIQLLYKKHGTYRASMAVFACAAAVLVNLIAAELPSHYLKYDVSEQKLFTTGEQTAEVLANLDEDVTLYLVTQDGNEDATLTELLDRYEGLSSHISVEIVDSVQYPSFVSQYTDESLSANSIIVASASRSKAIDYYDIYGYEMDYSSYGYSLSTFDGEGQITSAIDYVTADDLPVMYTLTGHDEASLSSSVTASIEKENIQIAELSLLTQEAVPEDCDVLLIYGALSDISEDEKTRIEDYMDRGGKVICLLGYTENEQPNLESLLSEYGITLAEGLVLEGNANNYMPNYPYYLLPEIHSTSYTSDVTNRYVLLPFARGIVTGEEDDSLTYTALLSTTSQSYSKVDLNSSNLEMEDGDIAGPFDVGAVVTKLLDDEETEATLVFFSSETLLDSDVDSMVSGGNSTLFMNVLSQLVDHTGTVSVEAKSVAVEDLTVSAAAAIFWGLLTVILIPLFLLAAGGTIWFQRRKR